MARATLPQPRVGRRVATLREWSPSELSLTDEDIRVLSAFPAHQVDVTPASNGLWRILVKNHAGILALPSVDLFVRPKIDSTDVLARMLGFAFELLEFKQPAALLSASDTLPQELLIAAFLDNVERLVSRGLSFGYVESYDDQLPALRGRIDIVRQLRANPFRPDRLACTFEHFTEDTPENRLIRAALTTVDEGPFRAIDRRKLRRLATAFEKVEWLKPSRALALDVKYSRRNNHYRSTHQLARMILKGERPGFVSGRVESRSFLINMFELWERFLSRWLARKALGNPDLIVALQQQVPYATEHSGKPYVGGEPDILVTRGSSTPIILDAKYKDLATDSIDSKDVSQLITYAVCLQSARAVLVYPSLVVRDRIEYRIANTGIAVEVAFVCVGGTSAILEDSLEHLFAGVVSR